jgi:hypothetical protein
MDKLGFIKIKSTYLLFKGCSQENKRKAPKWENIFRSNGCNERCILRIKNSSR